MADLDRQEVDAIVVGAGWSGLLAAKHLLDVGISVAVLEKRHVIGGVWRYDSGADHVTVAEYTRTSSSATVTEASDFSMPSRFGEFPRHDEVLTYLESYAENFGLTKHIELDTTIEKAIKIGGKWNITTNHGALTSKYLVLATGTHQVANRVDDIWQNFSGRILCPPQLKTVESIRRATENKRVLIVGGGETSSDIAEVAVRYAKRIGWSIRGGQYFLRKRVRLLPFGLGPVVGDEFSHLWYHQQSPLSTGRPDAAFIHSITNSGVPFTAGAHGIPQWRPSARPFHSFINKNAAVLDHVYDGAIAPFPKISKVDGASAYFDDGEEAEFDVAILCIGYSAGGFEFLPEEFRREPCDAYNLVFNATDPSLAYVGYARPVISSIPFMAEVQAKYLARIWSGKALALPSDLKERADAQKQARNEYFKDTSGRIGTLVEPYQYAEGLMREGGFHPDWRDVALSSLKSAFFLMFSPMRSAYINVADDAKREDAIERMRSRFSPPLVGLSLLAIVVKHSGLGKAYRHITDALENAPTSNRVSRQLGRSYRKLGDLYRRNLMNKEWRLRMVPMEQYSTTLPGYQVTSKITPPVV